MLKYSKINLGAISLKLSGYKIASKLVYFVLKSILNELINFSEGTLVSQNWLGINHVNLFQVHLSPSTSLLGKISYTKEKQRPVYAFLGVRYGHAPTRFQPPRPLVLEEGEIKARTYGMIIRTVYM